MNVKFVTAMRSFTYDLEAVKETMKEFASRHDKGGEITDEEAFDMIRDWAYEKLLRLLFLDTISNLLMKMVMNCGLSKNRRREANRKQMVPF